MPEARLFKHLRTDRCNKSNKESTQTKRCVDGVELQRDVVHPVQVRGVKMVEVVATFNYMGANPRPNG